LENLNSLKHLEWDSTFFARKIGSITFIDNVVDSVLRRELKKGISENYDLIYVFSYKSEITESTLETYSGEFVDTKVSFSKDLEIEQNPLLDSIQMYNRKEVPEDLKKLALLAGKYSRFKNKKYFTYEQFEKLYAIWLEKSISKEIADAVFIYEEVGEILGFVTVRIKNKRGFIGLISVNDGYQKKGIGRLLIKKVSNYLKEHGIVELVVSTQNENSKAVKFYLGNNLTISSKVKVYHFSLRE